MEKKNSETKICRTDDLSDEICSELASSTDHFCVKNDRIYLQIEQSVFCFPNNSVSNELVFSIIRMHGKKHVKPCSYKEELEKILSEPNYRPDPAMLKAYGAKQNRRKCAAVFRAYSPLETDLCSVITSMAPFENGDAVVSEDYQTAVYIKDLDDQSIEEMQEFVEAMIGTMETEGIVDIRAGIGCECCDINEIRRSRDEGNSAIQIGMRFHRHDHVFVYAKQTLERIVDSIPEAEKEMILHGFFGSGSENKLPEEMLDTVRVFFQNDLNLTAASKQLYIHRNTLNYRLDKIRKDFGLDLRSFQDAVIFRIISEIANEKY